MGNAPCVVPVSIGCVVGADEEVAAEEAEAAGPEQLDPVAEFTRELRMMPGDWYVVHSYAGYENRVKTNLESRIMSLNMEDYIFQIQVPVGAATLAPPVGTALGPHGVNIMDFDRQYNAATGGPAGQHHPGRDLDLRGPDLHLHHQDAARPGADQEGHRRRQGQQRTAQDQGRHAAKAQLRQIAETKMPDLNANDIEAAEKIIAGTVAANSSCVELGSAGEP